MPEILDIIDKRTELRSKADEYYKAIETWCRENDSGLIFYSPMNVPANHIGGYDRPHQENSFILARQYYLFLRNKNLDKYAIEQLFDFLSQPIYGVQQFDKLFKAKQLDKAMIIPDRFIDQMHDFKKNLGELKNMIEDFNSTTCSATSTSIGFHSLLNRHIEILLNEELNFDPIIINTVRERVLKIKNNFVHSDKQETDSGVTEFEMDLDKMIQIDDKFEDALTYRMHSFSYNKEKNMLVPSPLTEEDKIELLLNFFKKLSPEVIDAYCDFFNAAHIERNLLNAKTIIQNAEQKCWHPHALWSKEQQEHHKQFADTLDLIEKLSL